MTHRSNEIINLFLVAISNLIRKVFANLIFNELKTRVGVALKFHRPTRRRFTINVDVQSRLSNRLFSQIAIQLHAPKASTARLYWLHNPEISMGILETLRHHHEVITNKFLVFNLFQSFSYKKKLTKQQTEMTFRISCLVKYIFFAWYFVKSRW